MTTSTMPPATPASISLFFEQGAYVFRNVDGLELYAVNRDVAPSYVCGDECLADWQPLAAPADSQPVGDWSVCPPGGSPPQWCYRGEPVYVYRRDRPGTLLGEGIDGIWTRLKP